MPVYEYRCGDCGAREEHTHSITQLYNPKCDKCGCFMLRVISAPSVQFKGKGWAKKDRKEGGKQ